MIDLDGIVWLEYEDSSREPLALIETALDRGQALKPATVTLNLARRCHPIVLAYVLLYTPATSPNPAAPAYPDIACFRVRRLWPINDGGFVRMTPGQWARHLLDMRHLSPKELDYAFVMQTTYTADDRL